MKFFIDLSKKQLIKSAASNVALDRLVLKRRDSLAVEVVFVSRNAVASMPVGTTTTVALKRSFSDPNFLALASGEPPILDLNTVPIEAIFSETNPASISALLEIRWNVPGETTRNATLAVELQNSVILGNEGTPQAMPDGKASQAQAEAGTDNETWMTPLRTAQAIAELAPPPTWESVTGKPSVFPPESHTHPASQITGLSDFIIASAPGLSITTTTHIATGNTDTYSVGGLASADPSHVLVSLNGVTQTPGTDYLVDFPSSRIIFDGYPAAGTQISFTALGLRTVQPPIDPALYRYASDTSSDGLTNYYGRISNEDFTGPASASSPVWTIHRTAFNSAGRVLSTGTATAVSWANRTTATYLPTP